MPGAAAKSVISHYSFTFNEIELYANTRNSNLNILNEKKRINQTNK